MTDKKIIENPNKLIDKLFCNRIENNKKLSEKYDKLLDYIKPFIQQNEEMTKLMNDIRIDINLGLNTQDMVLSMSLLANNMAWEMMRPKIPIKIKCHKCGEVVLDMAELEKEFNDKVDKGKIKI